MLLVVCSIAHYRYHPHIGLFGWQKMRDFFFCPVLIWVNDWWFDVCLLGFLIDIFFFPLLIHSLGLLGLCDSGCMHVVLLVFLLLFQNSFLITFVVSLFLWRRQFCCRIIILLWCESAIFVFRLIELMELKQTGKKNKKKTTTIMMEKNSIN